MRKETKYKKIILETYSEMYKISNPVLDFNNLIQTTCIYEDDDGKRIVTDHHLSLEEMHGLKYRIYIPFEEHFISREDYDNIISSQIEKYKLNKSEQYKFKTQIALGCSPSFKREK